MIYPGYQIRGLQVEQKISLLEIREFATRGWVGTCPSRLLFIKRKANKEAILLTEVSPKKSIFFNDRLV
jgi:hypothetical protein